MPNRARISGSAPSVSAFSRRMRLLALFCVALVLGATSAQASHLHGLWAPGHAPALSASAQSAPGPADGEADCPLCTVFHAAIAPSLAFAVHPVAPPSDRLAVARPVLPGSAPYHFPALSRPPPR